MSEWSLSVAEIVKQNLGPTGVLVFLPHGKGILNITEGEYSEASE